MIARRVGQLLELQPEQPRRRIERRVDHVLQLQIRPDLALIEVEARLALLLREVSPVPRFERVIAALLARQRRQRLALLADALHRRRPNLIEKSAHRIGRLRHRVVEAVVGKRAITHQLGEFRAQRHDLRHDLSIVRLAAVLTAPDPRLECLFAQIPPGRELQERLHARPRQRDHMARRQFQIGRRPRRRIAHALRQSREVRLALQRETPRLLVRQHVLPELRDQLGKPRVDLRHALAGLRGQSRARPHERRVGALQQPQLLVVELQFLAPLVQILDPPEQLLIELDRVRVLRQHRRQLALDLLQFRARVRTRQIEEDVRDFVQRVPALFQCDDRVLERRLGLARTDHGDLGLVRG